jgi:hypothetical protein
MNLLRKIINLKYSAIVFWSIIVTLSVFNLFWANTDKAFGWFVCVLILILNIFNFKEALDRLSK